MLSESGAILIYVARKSGRLIPADRAGTAFGWYYLVTGLLLLPASAVFGALWENGAPMLAFGLSAVLAVCAGLVLWPLKTRTGEGAQ